MPDRHHSTYPGSAGDRTRNPCGAPALPARTPAGLSAIRNLPERKKHMIADADTHEGRLYRQRRQRGTTGEPSHRRNRCSITTRPPSSHDKWRLTVPTLHLHHAASFLCVGCALRPLGGSLADVRAAWARAARERRASSTGRSRGCRPTGRPPTGPKRNHGPGSRHDARHAQAFHALSWLSSPTEPADSSRQRASSMSRRVAARHRANVSRQDAARMMTTAITSMRCIIGPPPLIARGWRVR